MNNKILNPAGVAFGDAEAKPPHAGDTSMTIGCDK